MTPDLFCFYSTTKKVLKVLTNLAICIIFFLHYIKYIKKFGTNVTNFYEYILAWLYLLKSTTKCSSKMVLKVPS